MKGPNGGAAFPLVDQMGDGWPGMDLRTYIATAALQGLLVGGFRSAGPSAAFAAVSAADALIAALAIGKGGKS